jgi:hypothetical protein
MKTLGILAALVLLLAAGSALAASSCPVEGETELDCPWAGYARDLESSYQGETDAKKAAEAASKALEKIAPTYVQRLDHEGRALGEAKRLWGRSLNFDEGAKATIIPEPVIDAILMRAGVAPRGEGVKSALKPRVVHAGFEHTYGYLLSNLKTPYGFKRLRWVRPDIEKGFGLEESVISPNPKKGDLLANLTFFAGRIAFRGKNREGVRARSILRRMDGVAKSIRTYKYGALHGRRLKETLVLPGGRTIEIRTDFVPFTSATGEATGGNTELLIYSVRDSAEKLPYLLSAFPIAKGFSDGALDPKNLGENKPIVTRYNLFVSDVTDGTGPFTGKREAETF